MRTEFFPYEVIQTIIQKQWGRTGKATRLFRLKLGLDQKGIHFCKKRIIQITAIKFKNLFEKEYHLVLICMFSHVHNFFITFMYCRYGNQKQQLSEVTVKSTKGGGGMSEWGEAKKIQGESTMDDVMNTLASTYVRDFSTDTPLLSCT